MQIELIETFLDLCDTKSFNKTAERLGVTQSTVSGRVKSLEALVKRKLFLRSRSGTALTTEGLRFEPHARGLRHDWVTALNATRDVGFAGVTMRVGLQHDLVGIRIDKLIGALQSALPDSIFYVEADYSTQMCNDLALGQQDIAVLFSPQPHPDIHFIQLGDVAYTMVSTEAQNLTDVTPDRYILANYATAFAKTHAALLPGLVDVPLSIGHNAAMVDLLTSLGGSAYVQRHSADALCASGQCNLVARAPVITQPVFAGINLRNRHRATYKRMLRIVQDHFGPAAHRTSRGRLTGATIG